MSNITLNLGYMVEEMIRRMDSSAQEIALQHLASERSQWFHRSLLKAMDMYLQVTVESDAISSSDLDRARHQYVAVRSILKTALEIGEQAQEGEYSRFSDPADIIKE